MCRQKNFDYPPLCAYQPIVQKFHPYQNADSWYNEVRQIESALVHGRSFPIFSSSRSCWENVGRYSFLDLRCLKPIWHRASEQVTDVSDKEECLA